MVPHSKFCGDATAEALLHLLLTRLYLSTGLLYVVDPALCPPASPYACAPLYRNMIRPATTMPDDCDDIP